MIPIIETIINFLTPILTVIRNLINVLPWEPEINYAVVAGISGFFLGKSSEYLSPLKIGIIGGLLLYVILMFI